MVVGVLGVGEGTGASPMKHTWGSDGWPTVSKVKDPVSQEIDMMGSPTNYAPHDRPQQQGSAHPTAKRFNYSTTNPLLPPSRAKQKPRPAVCEAWFLFCTPYGIRTRVTGVRGRRPRPLDERGLELAILLLLAYQDSNLE